MVDHRSDGIEYVITQIAKCEDDYLAYSSSLSGISIAEREALLVDRLDSYVPRLVDAFDMRVTPDPRGRSGELALNSLHHQWTSALDEEAKRRALIGAFLATETERRGLFRLHRAQQAETAKHYEALGTEFVAAGLYGHAALAYQRGADVYLVLQESRLRDRCMLGAARARHRIRRFGVASVLETFSEAVCGYGYLPYRLLGWMIVQIATFTALVRLLSQKNLTVTLHSCLINFLNPLGTGDIRDFSGAASAVLVVEAYAGYVSMTVFFALLVKRWFQA